jgi:uncharacterized protein
MKVIIDTNVLVSAALKGRNPSIIIKFIVNQPDFEWVVSPEILMEYKEVLSRKKLKLPETVIQEWFEILDSDTTLIEVNLAVVFPRDQKDAKFLACALASDADFFITGDQDFSEAQKMIPTTIISVSLFNDLMCDS